MTFKNTKLFIGFVILFVYTTIGLFALLQFDHLTDMPMEKCPYIENTFAVCEDTLNHMTNWQKFSNVIFTPLFVFSLLVLIASFYFLSKKDILISKPRLFYKWKLYWDSKKLHPPLHKIMSWLSLFENSPASFSA